MPYRRIRPWLVGVNTDAADEGRKAGDRFTDARSRRDSEGPRRQALPADPHRPVRGDRDRTGPRRYRSTAAALARLDARAARIATREARANHHSRHQGLDVFRKADRAHER